jgi:hypothetical protein
VAVRAGGLETICGHSKNQDAKRPPFLEVFSFVRNFRVKAPQKNIKCNY